MNTMGLLTVIVWVKYSSEVWSLMCYGFTQAPTSRCSRFTREQFRVTWVVMSLVSGQPAPWLPSSSRPQLRAHRLLSTVHWRLNSRNLTTSGKVAFIGHPGPGENLIETQSSDFLDESPIVSFALLKHLLYSTHFLFQIQCCIV